MILLLLLRFRGANLMMIDFDFTLVNNHFNWSKLNYKEEDLEFDEEILELISQKKDYLPIIFTARGLRSVKYIKKHTKWRRHFRLIINCGNTQNKKWLVHYYIRILFKKIYWVDDLRDIDFKKGTFIINTVPKIASNVKFILWKK